MRFAIVVAVLTVAACAHEPKCGGGAPAIYQEVGSCVPRIRQVVIGSDVNVPDSIKDNVSNLQLEWVDSELKDGQVVLGHFILAPMVRR